MCDNVFVVSSYHHLKERHPNNKQAGCTEAVEMHVPGDGAIGGGCEPGSEPCRFPKLEECAHFHYERVQLPRLTVIMQTNMHQSLHSQHSHDDGEWHMLEVTSGEECWLLQRNLENFRMLDSQLHQCIYDRKISQLPDLTANRLSESEAESTLLEYLERFCEIADNSINCGPVLNWLQMDNKGHRLLVPSEESRSINTPAVAAAYSVRRYVSQARDELNLEVGDMISVIDMASPGESIWWRGKRGFQVGFFPQHCVHIIGDKVPRNMPFPAPVVGSLALSPIKPVLRKHGKLIAFFRSFILNRPSRRRLKQSGILKERVFGCDLGEHLLNSGNEIPMVLKCCSEFIETHGIVDGIYRLSGVTSNIQKLRNAFDEDRIPNLYTEDILQDIHSVASLLKMYFRELPNPLCTYQLYQSFVNAVQGCNASLRNSETDHERLLKMREAVQKLPPPHYRTLEYLMRHLAKVAKHGHNTGMTTRNVAIVWAPNLLRCAELEVGGVAALQGVGVQAVVTEFLICYTDLIFCDNLPNLDRPMTTSVLESVSSPKRSRPKSLAISTPTKLITLEEARSKHLLNKECGYIEVGGGPDSLPKKYHTIIELPHGARKRGLAKRSPSGWRSFFTKSRNSSQGVLNKARKASTPGIIIAEKAVTESDLTDMKRKLRSVKSAESLTSGHSEPASNDIDILGPLHCLNKPPGHNRSVSHDSYFDTLQSSHNNSEGSLLDLSEIQLNFELEESEMRIFSEDESLVSSPRIQSKDGQRRILSRTRHDDYLSANNSINPSPKKQARVVLSPDSMSRKRTRLEDQLSDIQFIDCNTPDNSSSYTVATTTTAVVHVEKPEGSPVESYQPRNKSPRSSEIPDVRSDICKRQSLNLEKTANNTPIIIPKSLTEVDIGAKLSATCSTTPTPQSPVYRRLVDSSSATTPGDFSPSVEIIYQKLNKSPAMEQHNKTKSLYDTLPSPTKKSPAPKSPTYENVLTTISIIYKSPTKTFATGKPRSESVYEDINIKMESAQVPTTSANLPVQQAKSNDDDERPKSFNDLESLRRKSPQETEIDALFANLKSTIDNNSLTDLSLSEVLNSSSEYLNSNRTSMSLPLTPTRGSPNVSPTEINGSGDTLSQDLLTPTSFNTSKNASRDSLSENEFQQPSPPEEDADSFPKCDTTLSELYETYDQIAERNNSWNDYENVEVEGNKYENVDFIQKPTELDLGRPKSMNLIEFSPMVEEEPGQRSPSNEKRKQTETVDDNIYQQVKYFRRSVHETNALLDAPKEEVETVSNFDSLEDNVYENCEVNVYENVEFSSDSLEAHKTEEIVDVKTLTNKFEADEAKIKKSLPPCLRARNIKNAIKTRSLDEDEFRKEFESSNLSRRKSFDENLAFKINTLPKSLNKPKKLPDETDLDVHLSHGDNLQSTSTTNLNRERIEKYKEERRKFLHDKYRSESFKEDKDVLLSRFKVFKPKDEETKSSNELNTRLSENEVKTKPISDKLSETSEVNIRLSDMKLDSKIETNVKPSEVRINTKLKTVESKQSDINATTGYLNRRPSDFTAKINVDEVKQQQPAIVVHKQPSQDVMLRSPKRSSIRSKTAMFEVKKEPSDVELRNSRRREVSDRHRHTFETREREPQDIDNRRVSLDAKPPRKEKTSPSYCIKDMKAIFESKSHQ